jgi:hypothetical protein
MCKMAGGLTISHMHPALSATNATATRPFTPRRVPGTAHLLIAFARAPVLPARMVSAYAWDQSTDFHAVGGLSGRSPGTWLTQRAHLEQQLVHRRWPQCSDINFMTIFGTAEMISLVGDGETGGLAKALTRYML